MLKKCLKYDFQSVFRLWWILAVSMLGAAILSGLGIRFFSQCSTSKKPEHIFEFKGHLIHSVIFKIPFCKTVKSVFYRS